MNKLNYILKIENILHQYIEIKKKEPIQQKQRLTRGKSPMKCIKCGVLLPAGSKFCDKCGTPQVKDKKCGGCGRIIEEDFKFCPECGMSFTNEKAADKKEAEKKLKNAEINGMKKAFKFISDCGVDLDDGDICDDSPFIVQASDASELAIVEALIAAGADIDALDSDDYSALHKACENSDKDMVKLLLDHNAIVDIENRYDETPLSLARDKGNKYIVGLLHKAGAEDDD